MIALRVLSVPIKRLRGYATYWEGCVEDGSQPFRVAALLAAEIPGLPEEVTAKLRLHFERAEKWIRSTLDAGVKDRTLLVRDSLDAEADAFMATMHGALLSARVSENCEAFRAIASSTLRKLAAPKASGQGVR